MSDSIHALPTIFRTPKPGLFRTNPIQSRTTNSFFSTRDCRRQLNGQRATPLTSTGDIPCVYSYAEFQRQPHKVEQLAACDARHLHYGRNRPVYGYCATLMYAHG
jgi:hypothetical protein